MGLGKQVRINRIFANPSGWLCAIAVDHFIGYGDGLPDSLRHIQATLAAVVAGNPGAVTMHKGVATAAWAPYAGKVPLILQSTIATVDDRSCETLLTPEEAIRMGADAIAVSVFLRGDSEAARLRMAAEMVREAARFDLPVICHAYPRDMKSFPPQVSFVPEDIAWAVHCAMEAGVDIVKTPYCGDARAYAQIIADCPVPLVAAGGPQASTLETALRMVAEVVESGAAGATIGRNAWGFPRITAAVRAFNAVIHERAAPQEALRIAGL